MDIKQISIPGMTVVTGLMTAAFHRRRGELVPLVAVHGRLSCDRRQGGHSHDLEGLASIGPIKRVRCPRKLATKQNIDSERYNNIDLTFNYF